MHDLLAEFKDDMKNVCSLLYPMRSMLKYIHQEKKDEPLSTIAVLTSREAAEEYITGDPFVIKGMENNWCIREWVNMFAV